MKSNHTPGPWTVNPEMQWNNGAKVYEVNHGDDGEVVVESVYTLEDANLIASAPHLLDALGDIIAAYEKDGHLLNYNVDAARSLIKKATGGQNG